MKITALTFGISALALACCAPATAHAACSDVTFRVSAAEVSGPHEIAGTLCRRARSRQPHTLLITAHGATYNRAYWNWPQDPGTYSFVKNLVADASILNVDLLGSGKSSRPLSALLTQQAQAAMLHQLVQTMRARGYRRVILVGHSSGSGAVTLEAATYHDVDGVVVTGFTHRLATRGLDVPLSMYPAALDPAFAGLGLDPGYMTTRPGTRTTNGFYNTAVADPAVIAFDESHKDVVAAPYAAGFPLIIHDPSISKKIDVPVLSLVGSHDYGFCDTPACPQAADEGAAWSPAARLELHVIANAGHDIHLHGAPYAQLEYAYIRSWLRRRFGAPLRARYMSRTNPQKRRHLRVGRPGW